MFLTNLLPILFTSNLLLATSLMALVPGSGHSDVPNEYSSESSGKTNPVRKSANYHPNIWGDLFLQSSPHDYVSIVQVICHEICIHLPQNMDPPDHWNGQTKAWLVY